MLAFGLQLLGQMCECVMLHRFESLKLLTVTARHVVLCSVLTEPSCYDFTYLSQSLNWTETNMGQRKKTCKYH